MHEIVGWGFPHLPLCCGKFIICTWPKMTCNYMMDLRKDIKVRKSPKITPISFSGKIKHLFGPPVYCQKFTHFAPFRSHPTALPAERWPPGQGAICSLTCPLPASLYRPTSHPCHFYTISLPYFLLTWKVSTPVNSRRFASDSQAPPYNTMGPTCFTSKYRNDSQLTWNYHL